MIVTNSVTPKAAAKHKLLFNKLSGTSASRIGEEENGKKKFEN
jgi:hypothetical protein